MITRNLENPHFQNLGKYFYQNRIKILLTFAIKTLTFVEVIEKGNENLSQKIMNNRKNVLFEGVITLLSGYMTPGELGR